MTETILPERTVPASSVMPRPKFHLTPRRNWMNDPNGLVYHDGLWHAYFQFNPEGADWGNMSWGHATSPDLLRWTEHPVALQCRDGEQIFSGSVVVGRQPGAEQLTAFYTSAYDSGRQAQSRATSTDGGYVWEFHASNPVLDRGTTDFRDPKVFQYIDDSGDAHWVLVAVEAADRQVLVYVSTDLCEWEHASTFGPLDAGMDDAENIVWECPDLIRLCVDGDPDDMRWVLLLSTNPVGEEADPVGSSMSYIVGQFDGRTFTPEVDFLTRLDCGRDFYAGVTFDNAPDRDAIMLGWMSNWRYATVVPTTPWRGAMSLPRRLSLRAIGGDVRLAQEPYGFVPTWLAAATPVTVLGGEGPLELPSSSNAVFELQWDPSSTGSLRLQFQGEGHGNVSVLYDVEKSELRVTRAGPDSERIHPDFPSVSTVPLSAEGPAKLLASLDGPLLEVFVNDGLAAVSNLVPLGTGPVRTTVDSDARGPITVKAVDARAVDKVGELG
ncbi:levanbiose-producing levanase [Paramicrobacterium humi]|uniref:Levanbiose-producing levanase n=1 Tax=Paramicrobacterium humi TaxID=640635 RepID=A0A1H4NBV1_9MICO|nr:glycoside hydrolase family 32 protein [Microbacterium humi]SEB92751.1 levanbiose-producing levanase [Microbacterium humi]